tara:strand:+ start:150 stop:1010 length:861 start_codon:yes stop_codon:yes gene_type:complete
MDLSTNAGATAAYLGRVVTNQIPFAMSVGINNTMTKARDNELQLEYDRAFEVRSKNFFKHTHAIFRTSKSQFKKIGYLHGAIQESGLPSPPGTNRERIVKRGKPAKMGQIARQVTGGQRKPLEGKKSSTIALPAKDRRRKVSRNAAGAVRRSERPLAVLEKDNVWRTKPKTAGSVSYIMRRSKAAANAMKKRAETKSSGGKVRKASKKSREVEKLFVLLPNVRIKPSGYDPAGVATKAILNRAPQEITQALVKAVRSARPVGKGQVSVDAMSGPLFVGYSQLSGTR